MQGADSVLHPHNIEISSKPSPSVTSIRELYALGVGPREDISSEAYSGKGAQLRADVEGTVGNEVGKLDEEKMMGTLLPFKTSGLHSVASGSY